MQIHSKTHLPWFNRLFATLSQETRWTYSTMLLSQHVTLTFSWRQRGAKGHLQGPEFQGLRQK